MKKQEIQKVAINSYQTYFRDQEVKPQHDFSGEDVILNKDKLTKDIQVKKLHEEKKHESLDVLRKKLTQEAEKSFENVFLESRKTPQVHKVTTEEMYEKLDNERKHLSEIANQLKVEQMNKTKH